MSKQGAFFGLISIAFHGLKPQTALRKRGYTAVISSSNRLSFRKVSG